MLINRLYVLMSETMMSDRFDNRKKSNTFSIINYNIKSEGKRCRNETHQQIDK